MADIEQRRAGQEATADRSGAGGLTPHHAVDLFHIRVSPAALNVSLGRTRTVVGADGQVAPAVASEWLATMVLSPVTAKDLLRGLDRAVAEYEKNFGEIPESRRIESVQ